MALIEQVAENLAAVAGTADHAQILSRAAQVITAFEHEHGRSATEWSEIDKWLSQSFRGTRASIGEMIGLSEDEITERLCRRYEAEVAREREGADVWKTIFWCALVLAIIVWLGAGRGPAPWEYPL